LECAGPQGVRIAGSGFAVADAWFVQASRDRPTRKAMSRLARSEEEPGAGANAAAALLSQEAGGS
jgi:hypothetical protein